MRPDDDASELPPEQRIEELAAILAAGVLRLNMRDAVAEAEGANSDKLRLTFPQEPCSLSVLVNGQRGQSKTSRPGALTARRLSPQQPFELERESHGYR